MKSSETVLWILAGIGVASLLWLAQQQTQDGIAVPEVQDEAQLMGMGVGANLSLSTGTPLEIATTNHHHGWHPGYDPDPHGTPVSQCNVRYPVVPGGNISTVMHKGWSRMTLDSPAGNDWRLNPPEAAVL